MKLTYEAVLNDPTLLERIRVDAHRERAETIRRLIVEPIKHLFAGHATSPSDPKGKPSFALDSAARLEDFASAGLRADPPELIRWTLRLDPAGVRRLYATYSNVSALPPAERERLLDGLTDIAERQFGGKVERNLTTAIYTARS